MGHIKLVLAPVRVRFLVNDSLRLLDAVIISCNSYFNEITWGI